MRFTKLGLRQRPRLRGPLQREGLRGPVEAGRRDRRPALRGRRGRLILICPSERADAKMHVQRRRVRVRDVRQRPPVRRQIRLRPRHRPQGSPYDRDRTGYPRRRSRSQRRESEAGPRQHGRADPRSREDPDPPQGGPAEGGRVAGPGGGLRVHLRVDGEPARGRVRPRAHRPARPPGRPVVEKHRRSRDGSTSSS